MQLCQKSVHRKKIQTFTMKRKCRESNERTCEATIHFNSDMSKSILSSFKKSNTDSGSNVESVNNPNDASNINSVNNISHSDTHTSLNSNNSGP